MAGGVMLRNYTTEYYVMYDLTGHMLCKFKISLTEKTLHLAAQVENTEQRHLFANNKHHHKGMLVNTPVEPSEPQLNQSRTCPRSPGTTFLGWVATPSASPFGNSLEDPI